MRRLKKDALRYFLAVLAAFAALFLRSLLGPLLGSHYAYHTAWLAVVFSVWYCGMGPSIVTTLIAVVGVWYWFVPPYHSFALKNQADLFGILVFLIFSAIIVVLGESGRRLIRDRRRAEEELRKAKHELEDRVRERTVELERKTEELLEKATLLDLANDAIFVKAANGAVTYWNRGAERLYGWTSKEALGRSTHDLLRTEFSIPLAEVESTNSWEGELRHTKRDGTQITVASRWTTLRGDDGKPVGWLEINTDITARRQAEDAARRLSGRILTLQDEERRRIARGLHDSLGQYLTALKLNLHLLTTIDGSTAAVASECSEIVDKCLSETRTLSHLLHPPLLDEMGFGPAAQWYVEGFAKRSGINVNLSLPSDMGRLQPDVEIALFRAVQETLTNVHRHSDSSAVEISLRVDEKQVRLEVKDNGKGIPQAHLQQLMEGSAKAGIGIAGMRERMRELGGSLEVESDATGTKVIAKIPLVGGSSVDSPTVSQSDQSASAA